MFHQIRSEWVKLRSVRSSVVLTVTAIAVGLGFAALAAVLAKEDLTAPQALEGSLLAQLLFSVLGVLVIGQEYRFNTIRPTFSINPRRGQVVAAKAAVVLSTVVVAAAAMIGASLLAAKVVLGSRGFDLDLSGAGTGRAIVGTWLTAVALTAFGFGIGAIVRQPIAGIMVVLTWGTVAETLVGGLLPRFGRWLPIGSTLNLASLSADQVSERMAPLTGGLYIFGVVAALMALGAVFIRRTDA
jgi:ABC-2 type transport system permease protein